MVLWMNVEKAREFLLREGFVYTLRPKERWWMKRAFDSIRRTRGTVITPPKMKMREMLSYGRRGKKGMVMVEFVKEMESDTELEGYVSSSGFESVEEWRREAGNSKFLFKVTLLQEW